MNTHVTFDTAKLLKEKRFDMPVRNYYLLKEKENFIYEGFEDDYWGDNKIVNWNKDIIGIKPFQGFLSAPTIAEVVMWLYEKHGIWIQASISRYGKFYSNVLKKKNTKSLDNPISWEIQVQLNDFNSPTEAYQEAINYCLTKLI